MKLTRTYWRCNVCHEDAGDRKSSPCTFVSFGPAGHCKPIYCPSSIKGGAGPNWKRCKAFKVVGLGHKEKKL